MTHRLISLRQQAASLAVAAMATVAVMSGLGTLAEAPQEATARSQSALSTDTAATAVQQVVIVGKRQA